MTTSDLNILRLTTAMTGPLQHLERLLIKNQIDIEAWFRKQWQKNTPPFYCSVDLRNAGFKLAPVDTNLFPAGFNNLNHDFMSLCVQAVQSAMARICSNQSRILLIPENHTRNKFYLESLATLQTILLDAGFETRVGSLIPDLSEPLPIKLASNRNVILEPIIRKNDCVMIDNFDPCLIVLNNDLSGGIPKILQNLNQPIIPSVNLGWFQRLKSVHFQHYQNISDSFARQFGIDPWLISPLFYRCSDINFIKRDGVEELTTKAEQLFSDINEKYRQHGVNQRPFIAVKADAGTYGLAVMMIQDPKELLTLNRKQRSRMATTKNGKQVGEVILQEGIYSFETFGKNNSTAEPVVYMIGQHVVGGFYRVYSGRGNNENLNAPGMHFEPLAFARPCNCPRCETENCANRFYAYGVIARLALLAAANEPKH